MQTTKYERIACPIYDNPYITKARNDARLHSFSAFCKKCKAGDNTDIWQQESPNAE